LNYFKHYALYHSQAGHNQEIKEKKIRKQSIAVRETRSSSSVSTQEKHQTLCRRESLTKSFLLRIPPEIFKPDRTGDRLCLSDWDSQDFKVSFFIEGADV